jgi:hypothetical protein
MDLQRLFLIMLSAIAFAMQNDRVYPYKSPFLLKYREFALIPIAYRRPECGTVINSGV